MDSSYITSALKPEQLPELNLPEVAFVGRSNTGKSTLLNKLTNRKSLARKGGTPGQTAMINFFKVNQDLVFADLPGYGFSMAAKSQSHQWTSLMDSYLRRQTLVKVLFLIDCRRQLNEVDLYLLDLLQRNTQVVYVLTKIDKLNSSGVARKKKQDRQLLAEQNIAVASMHAISSLRKQGITALQQEIFQHRTKTLSES